MNRIMISESDLHRIIGNAISRRLNESSEIDRLSELFAANKEWKRINPTVSGGENPYPREIRHVFLTYFFKNYKNVPIFIFKRLFIRKTEYSGKEEDNDIGGEVNTTC